MSRLKMFVVALVLAAGAVLATAENAHACIIIGQLGIPVWVSNCVGGMTGGYTKPDTSTLGAGSGEAKK